MRANELRIGDWVNISGIPSQIELLPAQHLHEVEPMPLTRDILASSGFRYDTDAYDNEKWRLPKDCKSQGLVVRSKYHTYEVNCSGLYKKLDYVHELQHLLWAFDINDVNIVIPPEGAVIPTPESAEYTYIIDGYVIKDICRKAAERKLEKAEQECLYKGIPVPFRKLE